MSDNVARLPAPKVKPKTIGFNIEQLAEWLTDAQEVGYLLALENAAVDPAARVLLQSEFSNSREVRIRIMIGALTVHATPR